MAAGPIMSTLSGAAIGVLIGLGIPDYEAERYEAKLNEGNVLISVHSDNADKTRRANEIFERSGGDEISTSAEQSVRALAE